MDSGAQEGTTQPHTSISTESTAEISPTITDHVAQALHAAPLTRATTPARTRRTLRCTLATLLTSSTCSVTYSCAVQRRTARVGQRKAKHMPGSIQPQLLAPDSYPLPAHKQPASKGCIHAVTSKNHCAPTQSQPASNPRSHVHIVAYDDTLQACHPPRAPHHSHHVVLEALQACHPPRAPHHSHHVVLEALPKTAVKAVRLCSVSLRAILSQKLR